MVLHLLMVEAAAAWRRAGCPGIADRLGALDVDPLSGALPPDLAGVFDDAVERVGDPALQRALDLNRDRLPWRSGSDGMPEPFRSGYASCRIAGPEGQPPVPDLRFGLYLQKPASFYPRHRHRAEEFYLPLSGHAEWHLENIPTFTATPGVLIRHGPDQLHAMRTGPLPLLAFWIWRGDLDVSSYRIEGGNHIYPFG